MKCPECNTEINDNEQYCPNCGAPIPHSDSYKDDNPQLGKGLVIFIVIGTIFLIIFGVLYYNNHKNDPEYTQTAIEPDSNLAESHNSNITTEQKDTTTQDSNETKEEDVAAEKVFNSIRKQTIPRHIKEETEEKTTNNGETDDKIPSTEEKEEPNNIKSTPKTNTESMTE